MRKLIAVTAFVALPALAQTPDRTLELLRDNKVPALGLGIIRDGKLTQIRVYGELEKGKPAPYNTIFNVASLTKPVVTMLTLKLVSEGKWSLDEPLAKYWVDPDVAGDPRHRKLTTRHVLTHQTGFSNWRFNEDTKKLTFHSDPGTKFGYSGEGFEYLARALEKKFNRKLPELAKTLIFDPLGMADTHLTSANVDEQRFARWHDGDGKLHGTDHRITRANAADDLMTTVEDYGRFATWVLSGAGLPDSLFNEMLKPQASIKPNDAMGLGWEVLSDLRPGELAFLHSGSDTGVKSLVILVPSSKQGVIIFTNGDNGVRLYGPLIGDSLDLGREILSRAN